MLRGLLIAVAPNRKGIRRIPATASPEVSWVAKGSIDDVGFAGGATGAPKPRSALQGSGVQIAPPRPLVNNSSLCNVAFRPTSALVVVCGIWGFSKAPNSYNLDYSELGSVCLAEPPRPLELSAIMAVDISFDSRRVLAFLQSSKVFPRLIAGPLLASILWCQVLDEAKRKFDAGEYASAARLFEQAREGSQRCDTLFYLGLARYRLKQVDAALIAFQSAVQCDPKLVGAHLAMGEAYNEKGNDGEALSAYTRALDLDSRNAPALRGASQIYLRNQMNDKAVATLEVLVNVEKADPQARVDLAAAYAATGDRDAAEVTFQEALRLKPGFASALMGLGNLYVKKGQEHDAIALLEKAVALAPKAFEPRFLLGSTYNRLGQFDKALAELQASIRLGGEEAEVYYHLARAYGGLERQEDRRQALARFAELTRKSKEDVESHRRALRLVEQAKPLVDAGDLRGALVLLEEARDLRPADASLLFRLAGLYFDLQRLHQARNYAQEAISLAPSECLYHYLLGLIEKSAGRWAEARSTLETATHLDPKMAEVHNALGDVALQQGDPQRAVASFERAMQLDPEQAAYKLNLDAARRAVARRRH